MHFSLPPSCSSDYSFLLFVPSLPDLSLQKSPPEASDSVMKKLCSLFLSRIKQNTRSTSDESDKWETKKSKDFNMCLWIYICFENWNHLEADVRPEKRLLYGKQPGAETTEMLPLNYK